MAEREVLLFSRSALDERDIGIIRSNKMYIIFFPLAVNAIIEQFDFIPDQLEGSLKEACHHRCVM